MIKCKKLFSLMMSMILLCGCSGSASEADTASVETTTTESTTETTKVTTTEKKTTTEVTTTTNNYPSAGKTQIENYDPATNVSFEFGGIKFSIPKEWNRKSDETDEKGKHTVIFSTLDNHALVGFHEERVDCSRSDLIKAVRKECGGGDTVPCDDILVGGQSAVFAYAGNIPLGDNGDYDHYIVALSPKKELFTEIAMLEYSGLSKSCSNDFLKVVRTAELLPNQTTAKKETTTATTTTTTAPPQNTYEHNEYYDIIGTSTFTDSINNTHIIHKVKAKKNTTVEGTIIAYNGKGDVIGKETDTIELTEGKNNYFEYNFSGSVSNAKLEMSYYVSGDNFMVGERNAVEMVKFSQSTDWLGTTLYVTVKQTGSEVGSLAKYKLLLYNGSKIVDTESGYFSFGADKLNGKGSTDVMEIMLLSDAKFNKVEFIYEP